jgi:signal transduction histidine kinase
MQQNPALLPTGENAHPDSLIATRPLAPLIDSLTRVLQQPQPDTAQVRLLCELSSAYTNHESDYRRGQQYAVQALALAESLTTPNAKSLTMNALKALGTACSHPSYPHPEEAAPYFERALRIADELGDKRGGSYILRWWLYSLRDRIVRHIASDEPVEYLKEKAFTIANRFEVYAEASGDATLKANSYAARGVICQAMADYVNAVKFMLQAQHTYEQSKDARRMAYCIGYIASIYAATGDYPNALQEYLRALRIADSLGLKEDKGSYLTGIGTVYRSQGQYARARQYYEQAEQLLKTQGARVQYINVVESLGGLLQEMGRFDDARLWFTIARNERASVKDERGIFQLRMGSLLLAEGKYQEAIDTLLSGFEIYGTRTDPYRGEFLLDIARVYARLERWKDGIPYATQALEFAEEKKIPEQIMEASHILYELYKGMGNTATALRAHERYASARDSIYGIEKLKALAMVESRAALDSRQAQIQLLERKSEINRLVQYGLGATIIAACVLIGLLAWRRREHKRHAAQLAERNEQLRVANEELLFANQQLDEATNFRIQLLSMASHDLKNPLSGIIGAAEGIRREVPEGGRARKLADRINTIGWRMFNLINDLLDTAARDMGRIEVEFAMFEFTGMMESVLKRYKHDAAVKNQRLLTEGQPDLWMTGDRTQIAQMADNLISNAIKYSPFEASILVTWHRIGEVTRFAVSDEGSGFTEEDKQKAFTFFQRLSAQPTGGESSSGVGLAAVKQIVDVHGGRVWIESEADKGIRGATFIVELPIEPPPPPAHAVRADQKEPSTSEQTSQQTSQHVSQHTPQHASQHTPQHASDAPKASS